VPRLSIIIAHHSDQRLEATLLSVLENRPAGSEVIVAHDGAYQDPYQLSDEVVFVQTPPNASTLAKLNEALCAACAPAIHVLLDGVTVPAGWCEGPLQLLSDPTVGAVSPLVASAERPQRLYAGLAADRLTGRAVQKYSPAAHDQVAGPILAAGFYSRKALLALGGWCDAVPVAVADVELSLNLAARELDLELDETSTVLAPDSLIAPRLDAAATAGLASIAAAHGLATPGFSSAVSGGVGRLLATLHNPAGWASAAAWSRGLLDAKRIDQLAERRSACLSPEASASTDASNALGVYRGESGATHADRGYASNRRAA
jgi:hypothetical protein